MATSGCDHSLKGDLLEIGGIRNNGNLWEFRVSQGKSLKIDSDLKYSITIAPSMHASNSIRSEDRCHLVPNEKNIIPVGSGIAVSYKFTESIADIHINNRLFFSCNGISLNECPVIYFSVRAEAADDNFFFNRIDPEAIKALRIRLCAKKGPVLLSHEEFS